MSVGGRSPRGYLAMSSTVAVVTCLPCAVSPVTETTTAAWDRLLPTTAQRLLVRSPPCFPCMRPARLPGLAGCLTVLDAIPPVVHVVTSGGVDWAAVVAPLAAAAAGAVGVFATARQARQDREAQNADVERNRQTQSKDLTRSIDAAADNLRLTIGAEDARADRAEKRRVYAKCMATFTAAIEATVRAGTYGDLEPPIEAEGELVSAQFAASAASWEVSLIAPRSLASLISDAGISLLDFEPGANSGDVIRTQMALLSAMRADLGLPDGPVAQQADSAQSADPAPGDEG